MKRAKPRVVLFADSTSVLGFYESAFGDTVECWWVTFHPSLYNELKSDRRDRVLLVNFDIGGFRPAIINRTLNKLACRIGLAERLRKYLIERSLRKIAQVIDPDILISDSTSLLADYRFSDYGLNAVKALAFRTVNYKKHNFVPETLKYDLILLQGEYHRKKLFEKFAIPESERDKFAVVGWPRMDGLVNFSADPKARVQFLRSRGLQEDRKTVLFAPTFNSFKDGRMFPNVFGDEIQAFEDLCRTAKQLGCNLIVKLHPFMVSQIGDPRVHEIAARYRTYFVNKKVLYHVESDSEDYLKYSDVLVSDTSGIITDFMALDRPIIFIEPDNETFNWNETDLSSDLRPGAVAHTKDQLFEGIADALMNPDARSAERKKIRSLIFDYLDGSASRRACDAVLSFYTSSSTRR